MSLDVLAKTKRPKSALKSPKTYVFEKLGPLTLESSYELRKCEKIFDKPLQVVDILSQVDSTFLEDNSLSPLWYHSDHVGVGKINIIGLPTMIDTYTLHRIEWKETGMQVLTKWERDRTLYTLNIAASSLANTDKPGFKHIAQTTSPT